MSKPRPRSFLEKIDMIIEYCEMKVSQVLGAQVNIQGVPEQSVPAEVIEIPGDVLSKDLELLEKQKLQPEDREPICIHRAKQNFSTTKEKWRKIFSEMRDKEIGRLSSMVKENKDKLSELGRQVTDTQRALALAEQELGEWNSRFHGAAIDSKGDYLRELYLILKLEGVAAVEMKEGSESIIVYTNTIYITHLKKRFEIGVFKIKIPIWDGISEILVENLFGMVGYDGYDHPFGRNRHFCFGALTETIYSALKKKEFAVAVEYILQALHSGKGVDSDFLSKWKEVTNE